MRVNRFTFRVFGGESGWSAMLWPVKCGCCWLVPWSPRPAVRLLLLLVSASLLVLTGRNLLHGQQPTSGAPTQPTEQSDLCPPPENLITAKREGRLGNIMLEYAVLLGASHTLGRSPRLLQEMADALAASFEPLSTPVLPVGCHYNWTEVRIQKLMHQAPDKQQSILLFGYPTAVPVFQPLRRKVLREFTFRPELRARADRRLAELAHQANATSPTFIAVHVRRTDYKKWMAQHVEGRLIGADFLGRALALMRRRHPDALFVVASDDLDWCRRELRAPDVVLAGDGVQTQPGADLALLAACNHSVLTHGTFGFWAAYLAGGEVVAPTGYGTTRTGIEQDVRRAHLNWTWIAAFTSGESSTAADSESGQLA